MDFTPGSRYEETRARLEEGIRGGTISVLEFKAGEGNFSCYFTGKPINGRILLLTGSERLNDVMSDVTYPICKDCYNACSPNTERLVQFHKGGDLIN